VHADPVTPSARPRARFRPLALLAAAIVCLPAAILAGPGGSVDVLFAVGASLAGAAAVTAHVFGAPATVQIRERVGLTLVAVALVLFVALVARSRLPASDFFGLGAALSVSMAVIRRDAARWTGQIATVVSLAVLLAADLPDRGGFETAIGILGPTVLLLAVTVLASVLAGDLELARRRDAAERQRAELRADLLASVRALARAVPGEAIEATVDALRGLGFDAAAAALLEGDQLVPRQVAGLNWIAPLETTQGHWPRVLAGDRTVVVADYRSDPNALRGVDLGTVLLTPLRVDGRPHGMLVAGRARSQPPGDDDIETVDVLAAHLGAALATERSEANQAVLLARLRDIDGMRAGFVARVSEDLRDPLTVVRGVAQTLTHHVDRVPDDQRVLLLERLAYQALGLAGALEALLDFSRLPGPGGGADPVAVDIAELLAPALTGSNVEVEMAERSVVVVDIGLARRAIQLLRRADLDLTAGIRVGRREAEATVDLVLRDVGGFEGDVARTLAEQLLVAAGARSERTSAGLCLLLPRVQRGAETA
jgi:K+-sensing histidine kinase KdpD